MFTTIKKMFLKFVCINVHKDYVSQCVCERFQALAEGFLDYLWKKLQNPNTQVVFRQAAVAYIASFLARAKHVNIRWEGTFTLCSRSGMSSVPSC